MIIIKRTPEKTLSDLEAYIAGLGTEPVEWIAREVQRWGDFSYSEIEELILSGRLDAALDWQGRYATLINEVLAPLWVKAYQIAAQRASKGRIILSDSDLDMRKILSEHGGDLITNLTEESRRAIANVLLHGTEGLINPRQLARQIRPLIGLNSRQAESNMKYRAKIREEYLEAGASLNHAEKMAERAAIKYASRQHRFRAETIMNTELAFAYNRGAHDGVLRSISRGYMNRCEMVWTTAGAIRTCPRCLEINGKVVGFTDEAGVQLPPLHPRCRCAIIYREVSENYR